jgi:hypothetical protein
VLDGLVNVVSRIEDSLEKDKSRFGVSVNGQLTELTASEADLIVRLLRSYPPLANEIRKWQR